MTRPMTERSRAYPVLTLEDSGRAAGAILERLGTGSYSREVLAEVLGHSNAHGGPGARKVAALTQYGLLRRAAGLYSPTLLAQRVAETEASARRLSALQQALRRPPLFRELLERYLPQGCLPRQLASILWRDHGITRKASRAAAETFRDSARYAGVLDLDGSLLRFAADAVAAGEGEAASELSVAGSSRPRKVPRQRFELVLTDGEVAKLSLPLKLGREDLEIIKKQIEFLSYQVAEED